MPISTNLFNRFSGDMFFFSNFFFYTSTIVILYIITRAYRFTIYIIKNKTGAVQYYADTYLSYTHILSRVFWFLPSFYFAKKKSIGVGLYGTNIRINVLEDFSPGFFYYIWFFFRDIFSKFIARVNGNGPRQNHIRCTGALYFFFVYFFFTQT